MVRGAVGARQACAVQHKGDGQILQSDLLKDLVETALKINASGFDKYHIAITRDYVDLPQVLTDKQQVLQVVANLIRNAKEAIRQQGPCPHSLTIRITPNRGKANWACIQMHDSGIGIRQENLHRIFAQSFPDQAANKA